AWQRSGARRTDGLRFFELADIGLTLAQEGQLRVAKVHRDGPMAKAGLKPGDAIVAVDGTAVADSDTARQRLRHAFVLGGAESTIRSDGKPLTFHVSFFGCHLPPPAPVKPGEPRREEEREDKEAHKRG